MILIEDTKYSCIECIRGHRSSSCRHYKRPLLQVRSKGRPNVHANGNPNYRVAVFAEQIASEEDNQSDGSNRAANGGIAVDKLEGSGRGGKCQNKKSPVIILKTSPKQVIDLTNGEIVGLYKENGTNEDSLRPPAPVINSSSFINSGSCCSQANLKQSKSCGCCTNKTKSTINKSKILKAYLKKHFRNQKPTDGKWKFVDYSAELISNQKNNVVVADTSNNDLQSQVFDVVSIPSCSIKGSCCCEDNCSCVGCEVHGNANVTTNEIKRALPPDFSLDNYSNTVNNFQNPDDVNLIFHSLDATMKPISSTQPNSSHLACHNVKTNETEFTPDSNRDDNFNNYFKLLSEKSDFEKEIDSPNSTPTPCTCPGASCDCSNCETHGIINGMKLDDVFHSTFDAKVLSMISDFSQEQMNWYDPNIPNFSVGMDTSSSMDSSSASFSKPNCCNNKTL